MGRASGVASPTNVPAAEFFHAPSRVRYRLYSENGAAWLGFERAGDPAVHGKRQLLYFIGSGHRGRTYLFAEDGFVFEAPINWYAQKGVWDMAPAFQNIRQIPMTLPALPGCLGCHTSGAQNPLPGFENKYDQPLFAHGGITCQRCHGTGDAHLNAKSSPQRSSSQNDPASHVAHEIVNPAKLAPARRDAICFQCHLEGNVAVEQPGRHLTDFRPGDNLADYVHYFTLHIEGDQQIRALGQSEALAQSACKRKSGDALWCGNCHDAHSSPSSEERVNYYRQKCLACHGQALGAKHHAAQADCTSCHMPRAHSADVAHTQATDHRILKVPSMTLLSLPSQALAPRLSRFPAVRPDEAPEPKATETRDLALAWQTLAQEGVGGAAPEAEHFLRRGVAEGLEDPALLSGLAYFELEHGGKRQARDLYERALKADPTMIDAATNLGVIEAHQARMDVAVPLWEDAFRRAPAHSAIGMNLARVYCGGGEFARAREIVERVLQFDPDLAQAKELERQLSAQPPRCNAR
jgi:predicted CXXCH cytochrome family protein